MVKEKTNYFSFHCASIAYEVFHRILDKVNVNVYHLHMETLLKVVKERVFRKVFWLPKSQIQLLQKETKAKNYKNESELMKHIIHQWFKK